VVIRSEGRRWLRRVLGAGLCCAGLVLAGVPGTTDGAPMPPVDPPDSGGAAVHSGLADGSPVPPPHTVLADGSAPPPSSPNTPPSVW